MSGDGPLACICSGILSPIFLFFFEPLCRSLLTPPSDLLPSPPVTSLRAPHPSCSSPTTVQGRCSSLSLPHLRHPSIIPLGASQVPGLWIRVILVLTIVTSSAVYLQERSPRESWLARSVSPGQCEAQSGLRPWAPRRRPPGQAWLSVTLVPAHIHTGRSVPAPLLPSSLPPSPHPVLSGNGMQSTSPLKGEGGAPCHPSGLCCSAHAVPLTTLPEVGVWSGFRGEDAGASGGECRAAQRQTITQVLQL